jgi:hypothetical protein
MQNDHYKAIAIALNGENTISNSESKIVIIMTGYFLVS